MASAQATQSTTPRVAGSLLLVCAGLSIAVHLGSAVGAGAYISGRSQSMLGSSSRISMPDLPEPVQPPEQPLRLGRQDSSTASIAWLGVTRDAVRGDGQESTVEQAELTMSPGDASIDSLPSPAIPQQSPVTEATPPIAQQQPQPPVEAQPQVQPEPEPVDDPARSEPAPAEPVQVPSEPVPSEEIVETPLAPVLDIPETESAHEAEAESENMPESTDSQADSDTHPQEAEPSETSSEPTPPDEVPVSTPSQIPVEPNPVTQPQSNPNTAGKAGRVDDRESVASIIKRAQEVRATSLNQPLSGEGLEVKPVEPKFPASVRFTQLPRNPIVLIRFNAQGRVVKAQFLRDDEKKKVYDTGSKGVDEPLINAIYKWRATGKQLEALDPDDPESTIEISMKIIFRED